MDALSDLIDGFGTVLEPDNLLFALIGVALGTFVGVLPGIGPALTIALLLPLTFNFNDPTGAFILFAGIYFGGMYGGSTTSILLNTPGESASVATAIEGFEMSKRGRAKPALATAALGSFVAGTIGLILLTFLAEPVADLAVKLQPADYFALVVLAFVAVTALIGRSVIRGLLSLGLGLAIGLIGIDQLTGQARLTLGVDQLFAGVDIVIVAVGLFAIGEALHMAARTRRGDEDERAPVSGASWFGREDLRRSWKPWLRGTAFGFPFGAMPTGGAEIPTFLSYATERRLARGKAKEEFGKGAIEGVAGPEAANNAAFTGVLVPLLTIGIPTSATAAILLASFQIFDLQPGPQLFDREPDLVWALIASLYVGNVMLLVLNLPLIRLWVKVLEIPPPRALHRDPRVRHARRLLDLGLGGGGADRVRGRRARVRHAALRLPHRPRRARRDPRPARRAADAPHAARVRRRLERVRRPAVRGRRARDRAARVRHPAAPRPDRAPARGALRGQEDRVRRGGLNCAPAGKSAWPSAAGLARSPSRCC
jgi:putative tricarboxylic transport membrane protein